MIFPCDKCGLCCKKIDLIPELKHLNAGDGRCIHLLENNLCDIYDHRPDICNISKMYELFFCDVMSEEEYVKKNIEGCTLLKKQ